MPYAGWLLNTLYALRLPVAASLTVIPATTGNSQCVRPCILCTASLRLCSSSYL